MQDTQKTAAAMQQTTHNQDFINKSIHNFRKSHRRINKSDKVEPIGVQYLTFPPTNPEDVYVCGSKAQLFDFIENWLRCHREYDWSDFQMFKQINQKLIS